MDEVAARATIHAQEAARIKSIIKSEFGFEVPNFAAHLAYETDISAADCRKLLEAATKDKRMNVAVAADKRRLGLQ